MNKLNHAHEPHLVLKETTIQPGAEWSPRVKGWALIHVRTGTGYHLQTDANLELETGAMLLAGDNSPGVIRASHLGILALQWFSVKPTHLAGLLTLNEQGFFLTAARKDFPFRVLPPENPAARRMKELCAEQNADGFMFRLKLLQLFAEVFRVERQQVTPDEEVSSARERLRDLLDRIPSSELVEMTVEDLARMIHCTPRHLSRIFRELVGTSFRKKRSDLRLVKARELLAAGNSKIVDVALESGYKSLSLFNLMFSHRFGTSPGKWRQKYGSRRGKSLR